MTNLERGESGLAKGNRVTIVLTDQELINLKALISKYGGNMSSNIKRFITNAFVKEFGGYNSREYGRIKGIDEPEEPSKPELTNEQLCEKAGGKVINGANGTVCHIQFDKFSSWNWPLDDVRNGIISNAKMLDINPKDFKK